MLRITKLTDYALLLLCEMNHNQLVSARQLSDKTKVPLATTNKILKLLLNGKLCSSKGGKSGGFSLNKPHQDISLLDVVSCIEGIETRLTQCTSSPESHCHLKSHCKISSKMQAIDKEVYQVLSKKFLSDLI